GLLNLFKEVPLVLGCVALGLGGTIWARRRGLPEGPEAPLVRSNPVMVAIGLAAATLVVFHWAQPSEAALDQGMYYQDTTWYHMSFSARFADTGEIGPLHFTDPLKITAWFYPQNSELLHGVGIAAFDNDFISPLVNLMWVALCMLAAWCIGRPYGIGGVTALGAAVVLDSEMLVGSQAGQAPNDIAGLFFLIAALAFLVDGAATAHARPAVNSGNRAHAPPTEQTTDEIGVVEDVPVEGDPRVLATVGAGPLFMAGLAAGLGIGTKITLVATFGALTVGVAILGGRRHWLRAVGIWLGAMLITSGFWYGRNVVEALNPLPQVDKIGPINLPGPDQLDLYPREPHSLSEYYNDPKIWDIKLFPVLEDRLGPLWPVILAVVVVGLVWAMVRGGSALMRILAATGLVAGFAYLFTPLTASGSLGDPTGFDANLRYVAPVLMVGVILFPLIPWIRHGHRPWILIVLFTILLVQGTITQSNWNLPHHDESLELALLLIGVPALIVFGFRRGLPREPLIAFGLAALIITIALGKTQADQYLENRYVTAKRPPLAGGFRSTPEWQPLQDWGREASGKRIGVVGRAGAFGQYFFYGNDLTNRVEYVGTELRRGTFRPIANCRKWRRTVNERGYDFIVTTPKLGQLEITAPPENLWTERDENVKVIIESGPAAIYRIEGPLDPAACEQLGDAAFA
ncbi:MAG TPA: hypothetical protein VFL56_03300, partial [Solirubrobacterales bacterium]|nr:hypothetical protein [Solirubrobacterales bacterium]